MDCKEVMKKMGKRSLNYKTLQYLLEHGSITSMEAFENHYNTRLSSTIYELRLRWGVPIAMKWGMTESGKHYGIYYIEEE